ncbi:conserved Plasmodium protein, unknown function [Plasmodium ovale]|uniref:Uncharacterized protein n=1 Tax=Plasmodium ovale TaxID=36330 RepID=A0A1C3KTL0_PLAOA|nr:conserved Plasmodium protein, unknown function [Plasmodium ovale]
MKGFKARNNKMSRYFNGQRENYNKGGDVGDGRAQGKGRFSRNGKFPRGGRFGRSGKGEGPVKLEEVCEYLVNISYILNEKYEKYFVYELKEENLKKGNKFFEDINLNFSYTLEEDISILIKIQEEIKDNIKELTNERKFSKIVEKLIFYCFFLLKYNEKNVKNDEISIKCIEIYNLFFFTFIPHFIDLANGSYSSHVVQTALCVFCYFNKYEEKYIEEIKKKNNNYESLFTCFTEICNIVVENIFSLLFHKSGTHVLRSFLYGLGGYLNINVSHISFRKSKSRNSISKKELKYIDKSYHSKRINNLFHQYIGQITKSISEEIAHPTVSLKFKNLLYQYIFYDSEEGGDRGGDRGDGRGGDRGDIYMAESRNQHFICPLLYNTYSVPALGVLCDVLKSNNVKCDDMLSEIFLIERTKRYYIYKTRDNCVCFEECPLKQLLDTLIKLDTSSIIIEKLLKMKSEHIFYVFNVYILKNINRLICDNAYSNLVMYNYLTLEYITEEMFDLIMKKVNINMIIQRQKFNVLKCLFDLSQCYKTNCKFLLGALLRNLGIDGGRSNNDDDNTTGDRIKFMWVCILCMCRYDDLHPIVRDSFREAKMKMVGVDVEGEQMVDVDVEGEQMVDVDMEGEQMVDVDMEGEQMVENKNGNVELNRNNDTHPNLNNYNFYNYMKIDSYGHSILSHILSFPKESKIPVTNSFKHFCNFLKIVCTNKPSHRDMENYKKFLSFFSNHRKNAENGENGEDAGNVDGKVEDAENAGNVEDAYTRIEQNSIAKAHKASEVEGNCGDTVKDTRKTDKKTKPFVRKNIELRRNILLYFCCDKNLSLLCEKIVYTFNIINEKYLKQFILLFKNEYKNIASNPVGAHTIITFFKLSSHDVKKKILNSLIECNINIYNNYLQNFMKLKLYKKTMTLNMNSKKYLKAKKLFEDILLSNEEKNDTSVYDSQQVEEDPQGGQVVSGEASGGSLVKGVLQEREKKKEKKEKKKEKKEKKEKAEKVENAEKAEKKQEKSEDRTSVERATDAQKDDEFMNVISDFIKNSKRKKRKRKEEKERIEKVLKKSEKCP